MASMRGAFGSVGSLIVTLFIFASFPCTASQDLIAQWNAVTLNAVVHGVPMTVTAQAVGDELKTIHVERDKEKFSIPTEALNGIRSPKLNTIQVLFGTH